jgi:hypothetical protein
MQWELIEEGAEHSMKSARGKSVVKPSRLLYQPEGQTRTEGGDYTEERGKPVFPNLPILGRIAKEKTDAGIHHSGRHIHLARQIPCGSEDEHA